MVAASIYLFFIVSTNHGAPPDSRASIRWRKQRRWCHIRTLHLLTISPTSASTFLGRRTSSYSVKGFWWRIYQEIHQGAPVRCQNPVGTFADVVASAEGQANGGAGMLDGKSCAIVSSYTLISAWHIWHLYGHHLRGLRLISVNQVVLFSYWFGQRLITRINRRVIGRYYFIAFVNCPLYRKINGDCVTDARWITENSSHRRWISSISREHEPAVTSHRGVFVAGTWTRQVVWAAQGHCATWQWFTYPPNTSRIDSPSLPAWLWDVVSPITRKLFLEGGIVS